MAAAVVPFSVYALFPPQQLVLFCPQQNDTMILIREFHCNSQNYWQGEDVVSAIQKKSCWIISSQIQKPPPHDLRPRATIQPEATITASCLQRMPRRRSSCRASPYNDNYRGGTRPRISSVSSSPESSRSSCSSDRDRFEQDSEENNRRRRRDCKKSSPSEVISSACRYTQVCTFSLHSLFMNLRVQSMGSFYDRYWCTLLLGITALQ